MIPPFTRTSFADVFIVYPETGNEMLGSESLSEGPHPSSPRSYTIKSSRAASRVWYEPVDLC